MNWCIVCVCYYIIMLCYCCIQVLLYTIYYYRQLNNHRIHAKVLCLCSMMVVRQHNLNLNSFALAVSWDLLTKKAKKAIFLIFPSSWQKCSTTANVWEQPSLESISVRNLLHHHLYFYR